MTDDPGRVQTNSGLIFVGVLLVPFAVVGAVLWALAAIYGS